MGEYALGQPVPRSEDPRLLRGGGRYVDDVKLPNMAYGYVLRSPHAAARIKSIDTRGAKQMPGVLAVLTYEDWKASGFGELPTGGGQKQRDGSPMFVHPFPPLVNGRVRYVGDYVAFVVADSIAEAMDASEQIEVDYEPLPAVVDQMSALEKGAPLVWDECPGNIGYVKVMGSKEKTDAAMAKAATVVKQRLVINRVSANAMEPRGYVGDYNRSDDHYTLYTTIQGAHPYRSKLATRILKKPESKVRVVVGDVGGSFGMKSGIYHEAALVLLASKLTGRPVKWTATRTESMMSDGHGRDSVADVELGLDKDGKFLALRAVTYGNMGAYITSQTPGPFFNNMGGFAGVYDIPAMHVDVTAVLTNTNFTCPYRGAGRPEAAFMVERIIDVAAAETGISPVELRRRNIIPASAMPYKTALVFTYDSGEFEKGMDMALSMSDHAGFEARRKEAKKRGKLRGIGVANSIEKAASPGIEAAELRFDRSGTATILAGSVTNGQGHETVFKQIVCDRLGMKPEEIGYVSGDTDKVSFGHGTGGSRSAAHGGAAVSLATTKIVEKARKIAAHVMEAAVADVEFKEGVFTVAGTDRRLTIKEVAKAAADPKSIPPGEEPGLTAQAVHTIKAPTYPNGTHVCEVEIDEETGTVEIVNYNVVDDVGLVMNPLLLKGQIQGGVVQGAGQILLENVHFDRDSGQLITASFMDYAMPRASDLSFIEVKSNPVETKANPLGIKGAGEAGNVGALPAVANALVNALSPLGIRDVPMPATPERLWRAIKEARA
jgi:carbon-monoxide dehydrogenase large subunit